MTTVHYYYCCSDEVQDQPVHYQGRKSVTFTPDVQQDAGTRRRSRASYEARGPYLCLCKTICKTAQMTAQGLISTEGGQLRRRNCPADTATIKMPAAPARTRTKKVVRRIAAGLVWGADKHSV